MIIGQKKLRSVTLIEILLVMALMTIITGFSMPVYQLLNVRNDLDLASIAIVQTTRRAQILSRGMTGDSNWGVKIQKGSLTLYRGSSFTLRDPNADEQTSLAPEIDISGMDEINFSKLSGLPQNSGTVTLTSSTNEIKNISINEKGTVAY